MWRAARVCAVPFLFFWQVYDLSAILLWYFVKVHVTMLQITDTEERQER